jgi:hypothetical protein
LPPASNRTARVIVYGLILAITGAIAATAIVTVIRASASHAPRRPAAVIAGHKHSPPRPGRSSRSAGGTGARVLLIAAGLRLPRQPGDAPDTSQAEQPWQEPQPPLHGHNGHPHGPGNCLNKGKR